VTQTIDRPGDVDNRAGTDLKEEHLRVEEPSRQVTPPPEPTRFIRWLAWIVVAIAVLGTAGLIWVAIASPFETEPVTPAIESIDPSVSPEILRTQVPLMAPAIETIDPHESPEILGITGPGSVGVDLVSLQSLDLLRSMPTQGIDPLSLESLDLLRSMPAMAPVEIDPHESPEITRYQLDTVDIETIDAHESPEILRNR
jgi:hypothetical protein